VLDGAADRAARVVDQDVDAPVVGDHLVDEPVGGGQVGEVDLIVVTGAARRLDRLPRFLQFVERAPGDDDDGAGSGQAASFSPAAAAITLLRATFSDCSRRPLKKKEAWPTSFIAADRPRTIPCFCPCRRPLI
jgi:hypothetical protein